MFHFRVILQMSIEQGPRKIEKLAPKSKINNFEVSKTHPELLATTPDHKLSAFYLKPQILAKNKSKLLPMKQLHVGSIPELFSFCGQKNVVHCQEDQLIINNKRQIQQKGKINHLLTDDQIALTTSLDFITINSIHKGAQLGQLHEYGSNISSIFWNNSLVVSGDQRGNLNLWDINKEKLMHNSSLFASPIDIVDSYVDFIHTNVYYSVSKKQRKIAFHDLRSYKLIKITHQIPSNLITLSHNRSGKMFLLSPQKISVIDLYQKYDILGTFAPLNGQKLNDFQLKYPQGESVNRQLTDIVIWNQYVIAACDNGCIEVYNSDTFECSYGYGLCELSGIKKLKRFDNTLVALQQKGILSMAHFA